jgi:hypothetical protein
MKVRTIRNFSIFLLLCTIIYRQEQKIQRLKNRKEIILKKLDIDLEHQKRINMYWQKQQKR